MCVGGSRGADIRGASRAECCCPNTAEPAATALMILDTPVQSESEAGAPHELENAMHEREVKATKAAAALYAVIPAGSLRVAGASETSHMPPASAREVERAAVQRLASLGGLRGDLCDKLRLVLRDWQVLYMYT